MKVDQGSTAAPKSSIAGSILSKKRMFEKDMDPSAVPTAPKVSKITTGSCWPLVSGSGAPSASNQPSASTAPSANLTPLQQFHSRKSLQVDPSELSVAQKARLFERQQKEQEQLRSKEQETNKWLNRGPANKVNAAVALQPAKLQKAVVTVQSPVKAKSEAELKSDNNKPKYYFGQQDASIPPPPPPLPQTAVLSPNKTKTISPAKKMLMKEDQEDVESSSEDDEPNSSPSMLIAKSVKPIRRVVTKDDKMYPSLTDLENNTETEDNETNTSSVGSSPVASCSFNSSMSTSSLGSFIQTKAQGTTMNSEVSFI